MFNSTTLALVLIASSLSLAVALVRLWRRKLASARDKDHVAPAARTSDAPPLKPGDSPMRGAPPHWVLPPPLAHEGVIDWWHKVDSEPPMSLLRRSAGEKTQWWVTWRAPWRRQAAERLWTCRERPEDRSACAELAPGLWTVWSGARESPMLAHDLELWRSAELCGVNVTLCADSASIGLTFRDAPPRTVFDLNCLISVAGLVERRANGAALSSVEAFPSVELLAADWSAGGVPPFGGLSATAEPQSVVFTAWGRQRSPHTLLTSLWREQHTLTHAPSAAGDPGADEREVQVSLGGQPARLRALAGPSGALRAWLAEDR